MIARRENSERIPLGENGPFRLRLVWLRGSKTAQSRRPGQASRTAAMVSATAVGWWAKSSMTSTPAASPAISCLRRTPRKVAMAARITDGLNPISLAVA